MKVLWLCNVMIPQVCKKLKLVCVNGGGWLNHLADLLDKAENIQLCVCAPCETNYDMKHIKWGSSSSFIGFYSKSRKKVMYDPLLEKKFGVILKTFKPDIVHIFGTECVHTLAMIKAFGNPNRTIINIQGLVSVISEHYLTGLPNEVIRGWTLRDIVRCDNILRQKKNYALRGNFEIEAIKNVSHVIGRTDWDNACVKRINPNINYYFCNEILRPSFYEKKFWNISNIRKHSILITRANYPIKGFHFLLEALSELKVIYPDILVFVAADFFENWNQSFNIRKSSYESYIRKLVKKYDLTKCIVPVGNLSEEEMMKKMLETHVFVLSSALENESNSLSEAKILGLPVVASYVGGVISRIQQGVDGFLYQHDAPYMLAYYIKKIFENDDLALMLSKNARKNAKIVNDINKNLANMIHIYDSVFNS